MTHHKAIRTELDEKVI